MQRAEGRAADGTGAVVRAAAALTEDAALAAGAGLLRTERIARLQTVRVDLAMLLEGPGPLDVPSGFATVAEGLPDADRAMLMVYSRPSVGCRTPLSSSPRPCAP